MQHHPIPAVTEYGLPFWVACLPTWWPKWLGHFKDTSGASVCVRMTSRACPRLLALCYVLRSRSLVNPWVSQRHQLQIAVLLYISSFIHQHLNRHTSRGECRLSERGGVPLTTPGLWAMKTIKATSKEKKTNRLFWFSSRLVMFDGFCCLLNYNSSFVPCYFIDPTSSPLACLPACLHCPRYFGACN